MSRAGIHLRHLEGLLWRRVHIHPHIHRQSGLHCDGQNACVFREAEAYSNSSMSFARVLLELRPIGTRFEVADIGTEALPEPDFVMLRNVLLGLTTFSDLQGM